MGSRTFRVQHGLIPVLSKYCLFLYVKMQGMTKSLFSIKFDLYYNYIQTLI